MLKILIEGVILYLLYRFVVRFVIPIYKTFKRARKEMREMNARMENMQQQNKDHSQRHKQKQEPQFRSKEQEYADQGEYIDYEEVD